MIELIIVYWVVAKHVLRYLSGTENYGLLYMQVDRVSLQGFTDANWAGISVDKKGTLGCVFSVG